MGLEQSNVLDGATPVHVQESVSGILIAEAQQKKQEDKPKAEAPQAAAPQPEAVRPEGGRPGGGMPGGGSGGFHPPEQPHPPERPPEQPRPPERPPEGPPRVPPVGDGGHGGQTPGKPPGDGRGPGQGPGQGPGHEPGHDPGHDPGHGGPIRVDPHPGDPTHGFHPGRPFQPPGGWGSEDGNRWNRGWDPWFFQQDPNFGVWQNNIEVEAQYVAGLLDSGNTVDAGNELNADMLQMRGDIYAQNQLLSRVDAIEQKGVGADLNLNQWDPVLGSWDSIVITPPSYDTVTQPIPLDPYDVNGNPI